MKQIALAILSYYALLTVAIGASRVGQLPSWNTTTDAKKKLLINPSGSLNWSTDLYGIGASGPTSAPTGYIGEVIRLGKGFTSAISVTSGQACNIGSTTCPSTGGTQPLALSPGDWNCTVTCAFEATNASTTLSNILCGLSKTSATMPSNSVAGNPTSGESFTAVSFASVIIGSGNSFSVTTPPYQFSTNTATNLYPVISVTFGASTGSIYGSGECRRVR